MLLPLAFPAGMVRTSTVSDSKGRWYDGNLVRFHDGVLQPWGGWTLEEGQASFGADPIRGMLGWRAQGALTPELRIALGTYAGAFVWFPSSGAAFNITPAAGFTTGREHATSSLEASCWTFDSLGEGDLLGVMYEDGDLWIQPAASPTADFIVQAGAPTGNSAVVVTPESFVMLMDCEREPGRVDWSDQGDRTTWTPVATNQAGSYTIPGGAACMNAKRGRGETLIWTNTDLWAARYVAGDTIYRFDNVGAGCGPASRRSMAMADGKAIWMGRRAFYIYDGFTRQIECTVADYVFNRLNQLNMSKVAAWPNPDFGEVTWFYPSGSSSTAECDSYVTYDYVRNVWSLGFLGRSDGLERGFFAGPYVAGTTGSLYLHETGTTYTEESGSSITPYAESGAIEVENGERVFMAREYIPDGKTTTGCQLTVYSALHPTGTETTHGPFTAANPTSIRLTGRQVRVKLTQSTAAWRYGTPKLEIEPGGMR